MGDTLSLKNLDNRATRKTDHDNPGKPRSLNKGRSSFCARTKIYLGMGGLCFLLALVAGTMFVAIDGTLRQSQVVTTQISTVEKDMEITC